MTQFIFVRHGQTDWNKDDRFRGRADIPLNDVGVEQARRVAARLEKIPIAAVYASPLGRTMRTAEIIAEPHGLKIEPREELLDFDYGEWQGKLPSEVDPIQYALWKTQPDRVQFPRGESLSQARARVMMLIETVSQAHPDETILLVSHDIVAKILLCALLGLDNNSIRRFQQDNAAINRFDLKEGQVLIHAVNETMHLE